MSNRSLTPSFGRHLDSPPPTRRGSLTKGCAITLVIGGALCLLLLIVGLVFMGRYNKLVTGQELIEANWSQVENQYKRRFDMIPNLVETVKGAADFERSVLTDVIEARSKVGQARLPDKMPTDEKELAAYMQAQQGLSGALGRLFALSENYPQLKATQNFLSLQDQIEGTENRIGVARRDYIEAVRFYNTTRRKFPGNIVASISGFEKAAQFTVDEAETAVPKIDFSGGDE
jgi:LemA protein